MPATSRPSLSASGLEERKLAIEEVRAANEHQIALERLALEARQVGKFSTGAVTLVGALATLAGAIAVALITGTYDSLNARDDRIQAAESAKADRDAQDRKVLVELQAASERLVTEQSFNIILQATKDVPVEIAAENLKFFVEVGILPDPGGKILARANQGIAPITSSAGRVVNPLMERASVLAGSLDGPSGHELLAVADGLLVDSGSGRVTYMPSPALSQSNDPRYAIIHFTGASGDATARWLTDAQSNASAHLLIRRDGTVIQLVPFDFGAWHAGRSSYGTVLGFNARSIGIELENLGRVSGSAGAWQSQMGQSVADQDVANAPGGSGTWQTYPSAQIETLVTVLSALHKSYPGIVDVLGHSDIAMPRGTKLDPGPLFPMGDVRQAVFGRTDPLPPPP